MLWRLRRFWIWLTDDHVPWETPGFIRFFARCTDCGRVLPHYNCCVTAADRASGRRVGCKCGNNKMRQTQLWFIHGFAWMICCYVWRKKIRKEVYWDPRFLTAIGPDRSGQAA